MQSNRSDDILSVATSLFRERGYRATSMNDVADMCHIQKASLYYHFAGKEELAIGVMAKVQAHFDTFVFCHAHDIVLPPEARLLEMNEAVEQFFSVENGGCLFTDFAIEQLDSFPAFAPPIQHYFNSWSKAYLAIFADVYKWVEAESLAEDFVSDLLGALIMMRVRGSNAPLRRQFARLLQTLRAGGS